MRKDTLRTARLMFTATIVCLLGTVLGFGQEKALVEVQGRLSAIWKDSGNAESGSISFYLHTENNRFELQVGNEAVLRQLENAANQIVRVTGTSETKPDGKTVLRADKVSQFLQQRAVAGNTRWAFILCRFADSPTITPQTPPQFDELINDPQFGLDSYWRENSYNKINLTGSRVLGWYNLPQPKSFYFYDRDGDGIPEADFDRLTNDATALADGDVYFPDFYGIGLIFNQSLGGSAYGGSTLLNRDNSGSRFYGATWIGSSAPISQSLHVHEMGHGYALPHSTGLRICPPYCYDSSWDVMSKGASATYNPRFGTIAPHTISYHKDLTGWIEPGQKNIVQPGSRQTFELKALQSGSGFLMGVVPQRGIPNYGEVGGIYFTVESRMMFGFDVNIPRAGVIIHRIDPNDYASPARVTVKHLGDDPNGEGGVWLPGDTFNDAKSGIKITVGAQTAAGFNVSVSNPARNPCSDYDGDGRADAAVFRPTTGTWYLTGGQNNFSATDFGTATDKLVAGDYDGDLKTDIAVFRSGMWYLQKSSEGFAAFSFGDTNDIPQPADYDGDGQTDVAVFRPATGTWYIYNLKSNRFSAIVFGQSGDKPVAADYDGDGRADVAVFRPANGTWYLQKTNTLIVYPLQYAAIRFGSPADTPVPADYDGDGRTDVAVFRPSDGTWYLLKSQQGLSGMQFGYGSDLPVPADYDGDGKTDVAVFRGGFWHLNRTTQGYTSMLLGQTGDRPINRLVN